MIARLQRLLVARDTGLLVIYVQNSVLPELSNSPSEISRRRRLGLPLDITLAGSKGEQIVAAIAPRPDEISVRKHRLNAFAGTDLTCCYEAGG